MHYISDVVNAWKHSQSLPRHLALDESDCKQHDSVTHSGITQSFIDTTLQVLQTKCHVCYFIPLLNGPNLFNAVAVAYVANGLLSIIRSPGALGLTMRHTFSYSQRKKDNC